MAKRKSPRVNMVNGIVSTINIGRINAFRMVRTDAVTRAVIKSWTCTPGVIYDAMITAIQVKKSLIRNFMALFYLISKSYENTISLCTVSVNK